MSSEQSTERSLLEARVRATNYMREWWSRCDKVEREHGTGIAWLADHVLAVVDLPNLIAIREALEAIRDQCGAVCPEYETCDHATCRSSYTAWALADAALSEEPTENES